MVELTAIQQVAVWIMPVLLAVTLHEAAHAWVASCCGDNTAKLQGRLSFNPLKHIDLMGTIILPIAILLLSHFNFVFGWAKPVPIDANQLRNPRRDMALSTAAGPCSNLLMALLWTALLKLTTFYDPRSSMVILFLLLTARAGILINLLLAFLNLIPIPPLDGGRIAMSLLPVRMALNLQKIEPYGFFILLALMLSGALSWLISPLINGALNILHYVFNL